MSKKLNFETTEEIPVPKNPLERVIGQDEAIKIAHVVAKQRRHLLLVGPPGTGKSMLAQAIAFLLPPPTQEISVLHNPERPERPILEVKSREEIEKENKNKVEYGILVHPLHVPPFVAERLGFRCKRCGSLSSASVLICPTCGAEKYSRFGNPFNDLLIGNDKDRNEGRVHASRIRPDGKEEVLIYERTQNDMVRILTQEEYKRIKELQKKMKKVLVPLNRSTFVQATGASEAELLGDVKHDPYGGHPEIGIQPYLRVVPGAVHEAHEGVLYIDELSTLGSLQKFLLTAMQEKNFPITGRNATSSGAVVKVDHVPCDFILIGAVNINDLNSLLPALRSRIRGEGYEILMRSYMEDTLENRYKLAQFVAQEIIKDGKIPHATRATVELIIEEARKWAKYIDGKNGLTLRLRGISGLIKLAGDFAKIENSQYIEVKHFKEALNYSKSIEEQIKEVYPNWWKANIADYGLFEKKREKDAI